MPSRATQPQNQDHLETNKPSKSRSLPLEGHLLNEPCFPNANELFSQFQIPTILGATLAILKSNVYNQPVCPNFFKV
jgi:hypothetical protein